MNGKIVNLSIGLGIITWQLWGGQIPLDGVEQNDQLITSTTQIELEGFPNAFNPSLVPFKEGFLLSFRFMPDRNNEPWISEIGLVQLNSSFHPLSSPQVVPVRTLQNQIPPQAEDARLFSYEGRLFLLYNDNTEEIAPYYDRRRDMYLAELVEEKEGEFLLLEPVKLNYQAKYLAQNWQKNWVPFEHEGQLFFSYTIFPHEVLYLNQANGHCYHCCDTWSELHWKWGTLRGGTPALQINSEEYLAFFHSGTYGSSPYTWPEMEHWHYFAGAYTFSAISPFPLMKITPFPLIGENFYSNPNSEKMVIFPGGFTITDDNIYLAYGKDDTEIWIAVLNKQILLETLQPVYEEKW